MISSKARKVRKSLYTAPLHIKSRSVRATLSEDLRRKYKVRTVRVRKGDTVKVLRGEYRGVEGKVSSVDTSSARLTVEGITREKIRGGTVPVKIHSSKVMVTSLNLEDKLRKRHFEPEEEQSG